MNFDRSNAKGDHGEDCPAAPSGNLPARSGDAFVAVVIGIANHLLAVRRDLGPGSRLIPPMLKVSSARPARLAADFFAT